MAVGFRRRLACLTAPRASTYLRRTRHKKLSYARARSASLPGRFHPVVAGLHDSASEVLGWTEAPVSAQAGTDWICDGVGHLARLLAGLTGLLHHPQAQDPLRHSRRPGGKTAAAPWAERLLDDLLLLADAYGCFREALLSLRQLLAEAHAAVRRRDAARLAAALRARRRSDRDISRLASTLRALSHRSCSSAASTSDSGEAALAEAVAAATCAAAAASAAIFAGLASASASSASRALASPTSASSPAKAAPVWWVADLLRWRRRTVSVAACEPSGSPGSSSTKETPSEECCDEEEEDERKAAMERLRSLEGCVVAAEDGCEQVYRALVNARVSLLNVLTPCF